MITVTATEFRAKLYAFLDHVYETGEVIRITKRGRVVVEVHPPVRAGFAKDRVQIVGDIMAPLDVEWEALKD